MSSSKQRLEANRANAKRSTGPTSKAGKGRSKMNALKHGLTAQAVVIEGEDRRKFEDLRAGLEQHFDVQTVLEHELVGYLSALFWRQRRLTRFDAEALHCARGWGNTKDVKANEIKHLIGGHVLANLTRIETCLANRIDRTINQLERLRASRLETGETLRLIESAIRREQNSTEDHSPDHSTIVAVTEPDAYSRLILAQVTIV